MPPVYRIIEVCIYALLNFLPFMLLALYPFWKNLRFSDVTTAILIVLLTIVQIWLGIWAAFFSHGNTGLISVASTALYAIFYFFAVNVPVGKTLFTLLMISNVANLAVISSKCIEGYLFPELARQSYRWSFSFVLFLVEIILCIPLFFLQKTLPIYLLIWFLACIVVIVLTRYLLKKSFAPTERILQSQKDFVATASHELKSPLAVMISNTDMLLDNVSLNEQAKQAVQTIDFECMRLSRLVKDMLLLASSDAKTWTLHKSTINVDTLLITLYETYEPVCMKQNLELKLHLSEESYPAMFTDKDRLFQILCVFMDNAIQHSKNNSLIEIEVIATEKNIAFSVVDHGQGISDEDKQYIFDRFYSGDKSHTNKSNFGLGLSIAKELTQMLNGIIIINDTAGGGATFTVKFPLK